MRKFIIYAAIFMIVAANAFAQSSSPIIGYDKVKWGTSIESVIKVYPSIKDSSTELSSDDSEVGIKCFTQSDVGNGIECRHFHFFNKKLYKVIVDYGEQDNASAFSALLTKLVDIYGKFNDTSTWSQKSYIYILKFTDVIRYYNTNLTVTLRGMGTYDQYNNFVDIGIVIFYADPSIEVDIEKAKQKQKGNSLGL